MADHIENADLPFVDTDSDSDKTEYNAEHFEFHRYRYRPPGEQSRFICEFCRKSERQQDSGLKKMFVDFFEKNASMVAGKVVLDMGFKTNELGFLAAKAGAAKVFLLMNHAPNIVQQAKDYFAIHNIYHVVEPIRGPVYALKLPEKYQKVDIILGEWYGNALFVNSSFDEMLYARDHLLRQNGEIFPNKARLFICGIKEYPEQNLLDCLFDDYVEATDIATEICNIADIDMTTAVRSNQCVKALFELRVEYKPIVGLALYFAIDHLDAAGACHHLFNSSPYNKTRTAYRQTILAINVRSFNEGEVLEGMFRMLPEPMEYRRTIMDITWPALMITPPLPPRYEEDEDIDADDYGEFSTSDADSGFDDDL